MYNYQTYLKETQVQKQIDQIRKKYNENLLHRSKTNPSLIDSRKKRIEEYIIAVIDKPCPITPYRDQHYEPRSPRNSNVIHKREFHLAHLTQKERIDEISSKNSIFDPIPFNNTFNYHFREYKDDSILKPMRYKSINSSLRIKEELESSTLNCLPNLRNKKIDKLLNRTKIQWKDKSFIKQINQSLLPILHKKNYFKSLQSVFTESSNNLISNNKLNKNFQNQHQLTRSDENDHKLDLINLQKDIEEQINKKEHPKQALIKCGLLGGPAMTYMIGMQNSSKKVFPIHQASNIR